MSEGPSASRPDYDVVIAGGGMVGISFALALNHLSQGALRILVAESFPVPASTQSPPAYRPSFDARATALAYGSRCIFENLQIWNALAQHVTAITDIHVSERQRFGSTTLHALQRGWPALGYVVENAWLGNVLLDELRKHGAIEWMNPAHVIDCVPGEHVATVTIDHGGTLKKITAGLLAIADGAQSGLREKLHIGARTVEYDKQAIIANVCCSQPHSGWAYERFTDWGPMALLPRDAAPADPGINGGGPHAGAPRMALVWTMDDARAEQLLALDDAAFLTTLQQRFGDRQGRFTHIGQRYHYALKMVTADEQIRRQIAVIGNAAHSLHPVAGQGFNLALRDVQRLAEIVAPAFANNEAIGELAVLRRYEEMQSGDQARTLLFSDRLTDVFERSGLLIGGLRHMGLLALDLNIELKNRFVDHTAGFHAGAALGQNNMGRHDMENGAR
jgi:2-polyprenyl-6-methoxyphenol 4-hydroxylase